MSLKSVAKFLWNSKTALFILDLDLYFATFESQGSFLHWHHCVKSKYYVNKSDVSEWWVTWLLILPHYVKFILSLQSIPQVSVTSLH